MPQRHSKNNNDLAFFTYDEKRKLGYGTQKERLGKDSIKPFDVCCLCLKPFIDPMCCQKGHTFCKECILECLLAQKKDNQRKLASYTAQQKQEKEEAEEKLMQQKARELDAFDQQNHGAVTSYEEEALRTMKAFWLPSATPEAPVKAGVPPSRTFCPEGNEKLKLKSFFSIHFTEDKSDQKKSKSYDVTYVCPSCKVTLTNTMALVALSTCGHVFCKKCADKFMAVEKVCLVCNKGCKVRDLVNLEKGGTGFAGHGDSLEARDFKHLGSGSGLGLVRPAMKT
ncbi:unnamed protein product [Citrullus colocynthis]|uniref:RING-type domain-containing protein n=1 Tax=Citrullus colocynthis TaxID=252529 RepID=A0ABP0XPZ2_9ROSI